MHSTIIDELNPHKDAINAISTQIEKIENEREKLAQTIKRFNIIDITKSESNIKKLSVEIQSITKILSDLKLKSSSLQHSISLSLTRSLNPFKILSKENRELRKQRNETLEKIGLLEHEIKKAETSLNVAYSNKAYLIDDIEFKKEFKLEKVVSNLGSLENDINNLIVERTNHYIKFDKVEATLKRFKDKFKTDYATLENIKANIAAVEDLADQLVSCDQSEKWEIHQKCEEIFGHGSPNYVLNKLKKDYKKTERDLTKLVERAKQAVLKSNLNIKKLVIDGNNLCHRRSSDTAQKNKGNNNFIGLDALIPLVKILKEKYIVEVVFDNTIKRTLNIDTIASKLNLKDVHIVNNKADEFILDLAKDKDSFVISNDKYAEYFDKSPVIEKRILNHEIFKNNLKIYDLDIDISF